MKSAQLRVSVIIPIYNEEKYLKACLDSFMKQDEKADEIIIVDNNSTDGSIEIAKKYPVKIVHEKIQGITHARNRGFNEAQYGIIARTDADTVLPKTWIKRIKKVFMDETIVAISGPSSFYDLPNIVKRSPQSRATSLKIIKSYNRIIKQLIKHDCLYGPNYALRKQAWNRIKDSVCLNDKQVHEDLDLAIHLAPLGKIKFIGNLTVSTSVRRWKKPDAYFEYLYRGLKSIQRHKQSTMKQRSKAIVRKIVEKAFFLDQLPPEFK